MATQFGVGLGLIYKGQAQKIVGKLDSGSFQVENVERKSFQNFTAFEMASHICAGQMMVIPVGRQIAGKVGDNKILPQSIQENLYRRLKYVENALRDTFNERTVEALNKSIEKTAKDLNDKNTPTIKTVYRWLDRYIANDKTSTSLLRKGFSGTKNFRIGKREREIIDDLYQNDYLKLERPTVNKLFEKIGSAINKTNNELEEENKRSIGDPTSLLKCPSRMSIYRYVEAANEYSKILKRHGNKAALFAFAPGSYFQQPTRILERVEIDHCRIDIIGLHDTNFKVLRRLWGTFAIDCYSKMILGFHITSDHPSYNSIMRCLIRCIKTKEYVQIAYPQIKHKWTHYGVPETIFCDNGDGFPSDDMIRACKDVGIPNVEFSPPGHAWKRPSIERFFKSLNSDLIHQLPGTTRSNVIDKGDYDSEGFALLRTQTIIELIHIWLDKYSYRWHDGIKDYPVERWEKSAKEAPPRTIESLEKLAILIARTRHKTLSINGLRFKYLVYNSDDLKEIFKQYGKRKIEFKVDTDDLSRIFVIHPENFYYVNVPALDQKYTKNLSIYQHQKSVNLNNEKRRKQNMENIYAANREIDAAVKRDSEEFEKYTLKMQRWERTNQMQSEKAFTQTIGDQKEIDSSSEMTFENTQQDISNIRTPASEQDVKKQSKSAEKNSVEENKSEESVVNTKGWTIEYRKKWK